MPDYGIDPDGELLPWSWAEERLQSSHEFWLATVRDDGRPDVMPIWALWHDGALWFGTGPGSRKARNIDRDPRVVLTTNDPTEPVILHGTAERLDRAGIESFVPHYQAKYSDSGDLDFFLANAGYRVPPSTVFGMLESAFTSSPTRWTF